MADDSNDPPTEKPRAHRKKAAKSDFEDDQAKLSELADDTDSEPPKAKPHKKATKAEADLDDDQAKLSQLADDEVSEPPKAKPRSHKKAKAEADLDDDAADTTDSEPVKPRHKKEKVDSDLGDDDTAAVSDDGPRHKHKKPPSVDLDQEDPAADPSLSEGIKPRKSKAAKTDADLGLDDDPELDDPAPPRKKKQPSHTDADSSADADLDSDDAAVPKRRPHKAAKDDDGLSDDDLDLGAEKPKPHKVVKADSDLDDDDSEADHPTPAPHRHKKPAAPAEDDNSAAAAAQKWKKAELSALDDDDDDAPPPPSKGRHGGASSSDSSATRASSKSSAKSKKPQKKHVFHDQTSGIMDLVQTPTTYAAWKPEHTDAALASSAKSELLAAEKAFDTDDDGAAASFLQIASSAHRESKHAAHAVTQQGQQGQQSEHQGTLAAADASSAAGVVLERYARSLGSEPLLQLAHAKLSLKGLKNLWQHVSLVEKKAESQGHDAEAVKWCRDFQRETAQLAQEAKAQHDQARAGLAAGAVEKGVLEHDAAARQRVLEVFDQGSKNLHQLQGRVRRRASALGGLLRQLHQEAQRLLAREGDGAVPERLAGLEEALGRAEGLVSAGDAEIEDIIGEALTRRGDVEREVGASVEQLRARLSALKKQQASLLQEGQAWTSAKGAAKDEGGLREHYQQMCRWTLEGIQARKHREEGERDAIRAALAVLSAR